MEGEIISELICPICYSLMSANRKPKVLFPCGHSICTDCFNHIISTDSKCPICKKNFTESTTNYVVLGVIDRLIKYGVKIPESIDPKTSRNSNTYTLEDVLNQKPPKELCEYSQTGRCFRQTDKWECKTCGLFGDMGICGVCARHCHNGHDIIHVGAEDGFYCDCASISRVNSNLNACRCCPHESSLCSKFNLGKPGYQRRYSCQTCGISNLCENCAIYCHTNHDKTSFKSSTFLCACSDSNCKCLPSFRTDRCTFLYSGPNPFLQSMYLCITCGATSPEKAICEACSKKCHSGHNLVQCGYSSSFCHCDECERKGNFNGCKLREEETVCTFSKTGKSFFEQNAWCCIDCNLTGDYCICSVCAKKCHSGHKLVYMGKLNCFCDCGTGSCKINCKCQG